MLNLPQEPGRLQISSSYAAHGVTLRGACWTSNHQLPPVSKDLGPVLGAGGFGGGADGKARWQDYKDGRQMAHPLQVILKLPESKNYKFANPKVPILDLLL